MWYLLKESMNFLINSPPPMLIKILHLIQIHYCLYHFLNRFLQKQTETKEKLQFINQMPGKWDMKLRQ